MECSLCKGRGTLYASSYLGCKMCGSSGYTYVGRTQIACTYCRGKGHSNSANGHKCTDCFGTGIGKNNTRDRIIMSGPYNNNNDGCVLF